MKQSVVRIASALWIVGLVLTLMMLSVPPADAPIFIGLTGIALVPLVLGTSRFRKFGFAALLISLILLGMEFWAGAHIKGTRQSREKAITQQSFASHIKGDLH